MESILHPRLVTKNVLFFLIFAESGPDASYLDESNIAL